MKTFKSLARIVAEVVLQTECHTVNAGSDFFSNIGEDSSPGEIISWCGNINSLGHGSHSPQFLPMPA